VRHVTSRQNAVVARFRDAARGEPDVMLLDGPHLVADALATDVAIREALVAADALDDDEVNRLAMLLAGRGVPVMTATSAVMDAVSPVRSRSPIVALAARPALDASRVFAGRAPLVLIAADVQDPGNAGAILRVAEAGGATGVIAAGRSADPFGWKALRGSMGSALRLPVLRSPTPEAAVATAKAHGCRVVATVPRGGRSPYEVSLAGRVAVLVGGEGAGLPATIVAGADERITIPMQPPVESLNTAVTAALIVYEARRQRGSGSRQPQPLAH
jgi:TrmH family RNA methyltransferase